MLKWLSHETRKFSKVQLYQQKQNDKKNALRDIPIIRTDEILWIEHTHTIDLVPDRLEEWSLINALKKIVLADNIFLALSK